MSSKRSVTENGSRMRAKSGRGRSQPLWRVERAGFLMKSSTASVVAAFGLSFSEHTTLTALVRDDGDIALTQTQLVERTGSSPSAMTSRIDRLEARGLVQRTPDPRDRRATVVRLTEDGFDLVWRALDAVEEAQAPLLGALSSSEVDTLVDLLKRVTAPLERADEYR
jgi:DNA-binding MarR family transcriptional regulator